MQVDEPQTLYREPVELFVAAFIGSPAMNLVEAVIDGDQSSSERIASLSTRLADPPATSSASCSGSGRRASRRPSFGHARLPRIEAPVEVVEELGADAHVFFRVDAPPVVVDAPGAEESDHLLADGVDVVHRAGRPAAAVRVGETST